MEDVHYGTKTMIFLATSAAGTVNLPSENCTLYG